MIFGKSIQIVQLLRSMQTSKVTGTTNRKQQQSQSKYNPLCFKLIFKKNLKHISFIYFKKKTIRNNAKLTVES